MDRPIRAAARYRNGWRQIGLSACILLLPPVVVGAAIHSRLATRTDAQPPGPMQTISLSEPAAADTMRPFKVSQPSDTAGAATFPQVKKTFPQSPVSATAMGPELPPAASAKQIVSAKPLPSSTTSAQAAAPLPAGEKQTPAARPASLAAPAQATPPSPPAAKPNPAARTALSAMAQAPAALPPVPTAQQNPSARTALAAAPRAKHRLRRFLGQIKVPQ